MSTHHDFYLPEGLPVPVPEADGLSAPFQDGLREGRLMLQRCAACHRFQWGPEWICHRCHSFDVQWESVEPVGTLYSWTRIWHPTHPVLQARGPYLAAIVELPHADNVRVVGNLLGDAHQVPQIGAPVRGVFEQHATDPPYALLQWTAS
ncbi:MAG: OB-fold domain-containing protein [Burkholderiaceae bacterium]|nr:OB-fold domain-containing protein [Burkholderiaceae bacterium]MDO9089050.1 OB-fold domain-containing protein [Burkholderiaceae bacterium]